MAISLRVVLAVAFVCGVALPAAVAGSLDSPTTTYPDLELAEASDLPRYYVAQGAVGSGASLDDPAPMGSIEFDGSDRAVVIVGESDVRTRLAFSFTERPDRFALVHASAFYPWYPAGEFRRGSVRVDDRVWSLVSGGGPSDLEIYRTNVTDVVASFVDAYDGGNTTCLGVMYNDLPQLDTPDPSIPRAVVARTAATNATGVAIAASGEADSVALQALGGSVAGMSLLVRTPSEYFLYLVPLDGDVPGAADGPRLDMLLTDGEDQRSELIQVGGLQNPEGTFPRRFLSYGVNLAHISAGPAVGRGWRGFICQGGMHSNVRFENFMDWLCGSQDVRGSLNIAGEGSKLSFVRGRAVGPGTDEGHKLHATVNAADGLPVGLDVSEDWRVVTPEIWTLDGLDAIGLVFNEPTIHMQRHQGYDDGYVVSRGQFYAYSLDISGLFAGPEAKDSVPGNPLIQSDYAVLIENTDVRNHKGSSRNYAYERLLYAVTRAKLTASNAFERIVFSLSHTGTFLRNSAMVLAPTSTWEAKDFGVEFITVDGRSFNSSSEPDSLDIVLDGVLFYAKENRRDGRFGGDFTLFGIRQRANQPALLDEVRIWTRNCVVVSDVPVLRLLNNFTDANVRFLTFDGEPGLDMWVSTATTSPGTGAGSAFVFTDGAGNAVSRAAFEGIHGPMPMFGVDPGIRVDDGIGPPTLPLIVEPGGALRTVVGTPVGVGSGFDGLGLASGIAPNFGGAELDVVPRYGPFGFGDVVLYDDGGCGVDVNGDGRIDLEDVYEISRRPVDINGDGSADSLDGSCLLRWIRRHETSDMQRQQRR